MAGISATIQEKYGTLTKKQKTIADHMLRNDEEMCFITLKQLSADVGCSEMTILNLCTALGYGNFNEVKYEFRKQAASRRRETVSRMVWSGSIWMSSRFTRYWVRTTAYPCRFTSVTTPETPMG